MSLPWWLAEPAPQPNEGIKIVARHRMLLALVQERRYHVRAIASPISADRLELVLHVCRSDMRHADAWHLDHVNLYDAAEREDFILKAASTCRLGTSTIHDDLAQITHHFEAFRDARIAASFNEKQLAHAAIH